MKYIILIILMVALVAVFLWLKGNCRTVDCGQNNDPVEPLNVEPDGKPEEEPVKEEKPADEPVKEVSKAPAKAKKAIDKNALSTNAKPANVKKPKSETKATAKPKKAPKK